MDRRQFIKSLSVPLTAGLTDIANSYEPIGLPKVPQSRFRTLGEPINPELLTIIKKRQPPAFDFTADSLTVEMDNDFTEEQQALIKHYEEADLQHIERFRNSFACVALNSAVIVADHKLKEEFDKQENIYGLDYIFDESTFNINEQFLKEQLVYTELLFIALVPTDTGLANRMLQIAKITKQMNIVIVVLTLPSNNKQQSEQIMTKMNKLAISHLDLSDLQVEADIINQVCIQAIRAPVEAATNIGFPSGVLEFITEILSLKGKARIGIGYARDESEISDAANRAFLLAMIDNDLIHGKGVNINITSGNGDYINHLGNIKDMIKQYMPVAYSNGTYTLYTVRKPELKEKTIITIIATGIS